MLTNTRSRGVFGTRSQYVQEVRHDQIIQAVRICERSVPVRSVVNQILTDTVDSGLNIRLSYEGEEEQVILRQSEQDAIKRQWPQFVRDLLWNLFVVGIVVVGRDKRRQLPFVVPWGHVSVYFDNNPKKQRSYWAEETRQFGGDAQRSKLDALVFVKYPPTDDGELTSPGFAAIPYAIGYQAVIGNQEITDWQLARPTWTYQEATPSRVDGPQFTDVDRVYPGQIDAQFREFTDRIFANNQLALQRVQRVSNDLYQSRLAAAPSYLNYSMVPRELTTGAPFLNSTFVPFGMTLANSPSPQTNPHFEAMIQLYSSMIHSAFGVPALVMPSTQAIRYASEPEQARRMWAETVRIIQQLLIQIISDVYLFSNNAILHGYAKAMATRVRKTVIAQTCGSVNLDKPAKEATEDGEEEVETACPPVVNEDGELEFPETETSLRRAQLVQEMSDEDMEAYVISRFRVRVEFVSRPQAELSELRELVSDGVMSQDVYARRAAEVLRQPVPDMLLTVEERLEEARNRKAIAEAGMVENPSEKKAKTDDAKDTSQGLSVRSREDTQSERRKKRSREEKK